MGGQSLTAHKNTSGHSLAATPDTRGPMNHHYSDPGNGIGEDRPMNHPYPDPGNGGEDRTEHSVNQIKEDREQYVLLLRPNIKMLKPSTKMI